MNENSSPQDLGENLKKIKIWIILIQYSTS